MFRRNKHSETSQRFSIKKYSFGVASALVGVFFAAGANYAQADNSTPQTPAAPVVSVAQTPAPAAPVATPAPVTQTPAAQPAAQAPTTPAPVAQTTTQAPSTSAPVAQTTTPAPNATTTANPTVQKEADKKAEEKTKAEVKAAQTRVTPKWTANTVTKITAEIKRQEKEELKEYVVQWGDTLNRISKATGTSVADLVRYNNIKNPNKIFVGDLLKNVLYVTPSNLDPRNQTDPRNRGQQNGRRSWIANSVEEIRKEIDAQTKANNANYVIQWGDTLSRISKASGKSVKELQTLNNIKNINKIYAGKELKGVLVADPLENLTNFSVENLQKVKETLESRDTDKDGLNDFVERFVTYTNPNDLSSNDLLKDVDNDGLTIQEELNVYKTNPAFYDTDHDLLNDGDEVKVYKTSPIVDDTDGDGARDGWEIKNGYNPLVKDSTFKNIEDSVTLDNGMEAKVTTELNGDQVETLSISKGYHPLFDDKMPGLIGSLLSLDVKNNINKPAQLSIKFDPTTLDKNAKPAIYYLNEKTKMLDKLETTISNNVASANLEHFSYYALLDTEKGPFNNYLQLNPKADPDADDDGDGFINKVEIGVDQFHFDHNADGNGIPMNKGSRDIKWDFLKPDYRKWNVGPRDLAFFASLAYEDGRFDDQEKFKVKMFGGEKNEDTGDVKLSDVLLKESSRVFDKYKVEKDKLVNSLSQWVDSTWDKSFKLVEQKISDNTQFNVSVFTNAAQQVILAFRGSDDAVRIEGNKIDRRKENLYWELFEGAYNINDGTNPQSERARQFIVENKEKLQDFSEIYITGHSLGGHLAYQAASELVKYAGDKFKGVINFSGPGFATAEEEYFKDPNELADDDRRKVLINSGIQSITLLPDYDDFSFEKDEDENDLIVWGGDTKHPNDPIKIDRYGKEAEYKSEQGYEKIEVEDSHSMIHFLKEINQGYRGLRDDVKAGVRSLHPESYEAFKKILEDKSKYDFGLYTHEVSYEIKKGENDHMIIKGKSQLPDSEDWIVRYFTYDKDNKKIKDNYDPTYLNKGRGSLFENINNVNVLYETHKNFNKTKSDITREISFDGKEIVFSAPTQKELVEENVKEVNWEWVHKHVEQNSKLNTAKNSKIV